MSDAYRRIEAMLQRAHNAVLFLLARAAFTETNWQEMNRRSYEPRFVPTAHQQFDEDRALFLFGEQAKASDSTDARAQHFMTLAVSLLAIGVVFLRDVRSVWPIVVATIALLASIMLWAACLTVRNQTTPSLNHTANACAKPDTWARDLVYSRYANDASHRFRVDLFRAGMRWFGLAVIMAAVALLLSRPI